MHAGTSPKQYAPQLFQSWGRNHKNCKISQTELGTSGIILAQNDDGPLNRTMAHIPFKFPNFNGPFEIFMGHLQNLIGPRILNIHIRA